MERKSINEIVALATGSSTGHTSFAPTSEPNQKAPNRQNENPASTARPLPAAEPAAVMHLELVRLIERVHRRYLDLFRIDLTRLGADDLSPTQVMMLFTIGDDDLSVRDLIDRGYYLGSNASYNLKQLVDTGYVDRNASPRDRRSARIRLSDKGRQLCELVRKVDETYHGLVARNEEEARELEIAFHTLRRLEHVWTNALRYGEARIS